jgi:multisubunit Na+/H+ antiporter MnhE subunit
MISAVVTPSLRNFLLISGLLCLIWGISAIGLEIAILIYSYSTYYRGLWMGGYLIGCGISMLFAACQSSYKFFTLTGMLVVALIFCILGAALSALNYSSSMRCSDSYYIFMCDSVLATDLKLAILALSIVATVHTIINMVIIQSTHNKAVLAATSRR